MRHARLFGILLGLFLVSAGGVFVLTHQNREEFPPEVLIAGLQGGEKLLEEDALFEASLQTEQTEETEELVEATQPQPSPAPPAGGAPQGPPPSGTSASQGKININTAGYEELQRITGVGPVLAQKIIDWRNANGLFYEIEDIKQVSGIGEATFEKMKDEITVGDVPPRPAPPPEPPPPQENSAPDQEKEAEKPPAQPPPPPQPTVALTFPSSHRVDEELLVLLAALDLDASVYDVKISIESEGVLSRTYDSGTWRSSTFYVGNAITGPSVSDKEFRLVIQEDKQGFRGVADVFVRIRKSGTSSGQLVFSGKITIQEPVQIEEEKPPSPSDEPSVVTPPAEDSPIEAYSILIAEVQIAGDVSTNDFIRIYNPNETMVDISGWKLRKRTQSGSESSIRLFPAESIISSGGYLTWANSSGGFAESIGADELTTQTIAANNSIALLDSSNTIIDALAWGEGHIDPFVMGSPFPVNPGAHEILARKVVNGVMQNAGNNAQDFEISI